MRGRGAVRGGVNNEKGVCVEGRSLYVGPLLVVPL